MSSLHWNLKLSFFAYLKENDPKYIQEMIKNTFGMSYDKRD